MDNYSQRKTILFLHTEFMGYTFAFAKALINNYKFDIHIVKKDKNLSRKYIPESYSGLSYYNRSEYKNKQKLLNLIEKIQPKLIYITNWNDFHLKKIAFSYKKKNGDIPIVTATDHSWKGSLRQHGGVILAQLLLHRYFSHIWVAGIRQYEFARRLGFKHNQILPFLYSADLTLFNAAFKQSYSVKEKKYPKKILFVGRFTKVKGIDLLISAFKSIPKNKRINWSLRLIGNGDFPITNSEDVEILDFLQPNELIQEIKTAGIFCLPSTYEPWGVVIHEFAAGGLPLLISDECGASSSFLINGYNGYVFKNGIIQSLKEKLELMISLSDKQLFSMGKNSHNLSQRITPELSAAALISIIT